MSQAVRRPVAYLRLRAWWRRSREDAVQTLLTVVYLALVGFLSLFVLAQ